MNPRGAWKLLTAVVVLWSLCFSAFVHAEIMVLGDPPGCSLSLDGEISADSVSRVIKLPCERVTIFLDSPGGDFHAAMDLGRWLRARQSYAHVLSDAVCLSSCALVYIGAMTRESDGVIGLHRPYLGGRPLLEEAVKETVETMMRNLRDYVAEMNITQEFADIMQNTPPSDVRIFRGTEIQRLVPDRDFVDEEMEAARNAGAFRLSVEEYRKRDRIAELECFETKYVSPEAYYECRTPIVLGITKLEFEARQARMFEECYQEGLAWLSHSKDPQHPATQAFNECTRDVMAGRR